MDSQGLNREKKYFRLCIEYLRQSRDYKDFCEWTVKRRNSRALPVPDKFKKDPKTGSAPKELFNYFVFGNIHDPSFSFDAWFAWHKDKERYTEQHSSPNPIENYLDLLERDIDASIDSFKRHHGGRLPRLQEFRSFFPKWLKNMSAGRLLYLLINPTATNPKNITNHLEKLLLEQKKPFRHWFNHSMPDPRGIKFSALERYLAVYIKREKEKMKWKDIIGRVSPKQNYEDIRRTFQMDLQKAKKIIHNVERGIFPGKY